MLSSLKQMIKEVLNCRQELKRWLLHTIRLWTLKWLIIGTLRRLKNAKMIESFVLNKYLTRHENLSNRKFLSKGLGSSVTSGWKSSDLIVKVYSSNSDDVHLIGRIVKCAIEWAVVADGRDHYHVIRSQFPDLDQKMAIRYKKLQIQNVRWFLLACLCGLHL